MDIKIKINVNENRNLNLIAAKMIGNNARRGYKLVLLKYSIIT